MEKVENEILTGPCRYCYALARECEQLECENDRVVMNPPFRVDGDPQADVSHVLHAWKCLKPGGRLVSIMSAGVIFRENQKTVAFRKSLKQYGHYERNPEGSFKLSGTMVNTIIVVLDKPNKKA